MIPEIHLEIINSQRVKPVEVNKPNKSYQKSFPYLEFCVAQEEKVLGSGSKIDQHRGYCFSLNVTPKSNVFW